MRYFRRDAESELGEGVAYMAVDDEGVVVAQVEIYGAQRFWSTQDAEVDPRFAICDQGLSELGLGPEYEVTKAQFEEAWRAAGGR